jgi:hypothetical protein
MNPTIYKKFVRTTIKIGGKYMKFTAHPRSLDGTCVPDETC